MIINNNNDKNNNNKISLLLLLNLILDKVIRENELKTWILHKLIRLGRKIKGIDIGCLSFADDLAIHTDNTKTAV